MVFVDKVKNSSPPILEEYKKNNTKDWEEYFKNKSTKKPEDLWNHEEIRKKLTDIFKECCAYCGRINDITEDGKYTAQVEHFRPKSKRPDLVYDWHNLNWSCKECNSVTMKGDYYKEDYMIFDPCDKIDVDYLIINEQNGEYQLKEEFANDKKIKERFDITRKKTMINSRGKRRQKNYKDIKELLNEIKKYYKQSNELKSKVLEEKLSNTIKELQEVYNTSEFKLLAFSLIQQFQKDNPDINLKIS